MFLCALVAVGSLVTACLCASSNAAAAWFDCNSAKEREKTFLSVSRLLEAVARSASREGIAKVDFRISSFGQICFALLRFLFIIFFLCAYDLGG